MTCCRQPPPSPGAPTTPPSPSLPSLPCRCPRAWPRSEWWGSDAVAAAVERAGGLNEIRPGQTVFIKSNAVHPVSASAGFPAVTTSLAVLPVVIRLLRRRRPGKIIVGDRSARILHSSFVFRLTGLREAALAAATGTSRFGSSSGA